MPRALLCIALFAACHAEAPAPPDSTPVSTVQDTRFHRLTRAQYARSLRELFGTDVGVATMLPADATTAGFDNTDAGLSLAPDLMEALLAAAETVATRVTSPPSRDETFGWNQPGASVHANVVDGDLLEIAPRNADRVEKLALPLEDLRAGTWTLELHGEQSFVLTREGGVTLSIDGLPLVVTQSDDLEHAVWSTTFDTTDGTHLLSINSAVMSDEGPWAAHLSDLRLVGPTPAATDGVYERLMTCAPSADTDDAWRTCADQILQPLLRRAWRGVVPPQAAQQVIDQAVSERAVGRPFRAGIRQALVRALMSPYFLFRVEEPQENGRLDAFALASRLAFFLWAGPPDDTLLSLAEDGTLTDPDVLAAQVQRLIDNPRVAGFEEDFAGQWLMFRNLEAKRLDATYYPQFDASLRTAMVAEAMGLVDDMLHSNRPIPDLLSYPTGHIHEPLATLYGTLAGEAVPLAGVGRGGLLGLGAVHAMTSKEARTSIVSRGVWVMASLLCEEPGSPPANVPVQPESDDPRDAVDAHTADPVCAACHTAFDPFGVAMEHFDADGAWRDTYPSGVPVDSTTTLPDGTAAAGAADLATWLQADPRFVRCVAEKSLTWAVGRIVTDDEVDEVMQAGGSSPSSFPDLLRRVAASSAFQTVWGAP